MPDGTLIRNVPEGTTQSELLRKLDALKQPEKAASKVTVQDLATKGPSAMPASPEHLPMLGGFLGAAVVPGAGLGALALQSLGAAGGATAGELSRQAISDEPIDPLKAGKEGAIQGAFNLGGGLALKSLTGAAHKIFGTKLGAPEKAAAEFAESQGAPFPLSSAAQGSKPARLSSLTNIAIGGKIKNQSDAVKVGQFINRELSKIDSRAEVLDEASSAAQTVVKNVFDERGAITRSMTAFKARAGVEAEIPIPNLKEAFEKALHLIDRGGNARTEAGRKVKGLMRFHGGDSRDAGHMLPQDIDDLLFTGPSKGGARRVIQAAAIKDLDAYAQSIGIKGFGDELVAAIRGARKTFELGEEVPGLAKLAEKASDPKTILWANQAMENPATREWLKKQSPETFHNLADAWAANQFMRAATPSRAAVGQTANGAQVRAWFEQSQGTLSGVLGKSQMRAWDNFTLYMKFMDKARQTGATPIDSGFMLGRVSAELGAVFAKPGAVGLIIPGEGAAFVLARGLNNPSSTLFKLFTDGISPAVRSAWIKAAGVSGQAGAHGRDENTR
jgi:hypothetical protein